MAESKIDNQQDGKSQGVEENKLFGFYDSQTSTFYHFPQDCLLGSDVVIAQSQELLSQHSPSRIPKRPSGQR